MSYQGTKTIGGGGMPFVDARQGQRDINQMKEQARQRKEKGSALADDQKRLEMLAQGLGAGKEVKSMSRGELKGFIENKLAMATKEKDAADRDLSERKHQGDIRRLGQGDKQLELQKREMDYKQRPSPLKGILDKGMARPQGDFDPSIPLEQRQQTQAAKWPGSGPHQKAGMPGQYDLEGLTQSMSSQQRQGFAAGAGPPTPDFREALKNDPATKDRFAMENFLRKQDPSGAAEAFARGGGSVTDMQQFFQNSQLGGVKAVNDPNTGKEMGYEFRTSKNHRQFIPKADMVPLKPQAAIALVNEIAKAIEEGNTKRLKLLLQKELIKKDILKGNDHDRWPDNIQDMIEESEANRKQTPTK